MYLLFDIGGTKMRLVLSKDGKDISEPIIVDTPQNFDGAIQVFKDNFNKITKGKTVKKAVGGIAGVLDKDGTKLINSPNLPGWNDRSLKESLRQILGCEVVVKNDADLAGLGEAVKGAGKDCSIVAYITISTGIGGTRIVNGKIDISTFGFEPGHQIIDADGTIMDKTSDLEALVSGAGIKKRFGKEPEEIENAKTWEELTELLAIGLTNTIVHWSPEILILGGGIIGARRMSLTKLKAFIRLYLEIFPEIPEICQSELGDLAGLHGALCYLNNSMQS